MDIDFSSTQKKTVAAGITLLALTVVFTFAGFLVWAGVRALAFAAPAIVPVVAGFFLALFFKPYYRLWLKWVRRPAPAATLMLLTVLVPLALILWYAGSVLVEQASNLIAQGPELVARVHAWFVSTCPRLNAFLGQLGVMPQDGSALYTRYGATALKAGAGAFKCLTGAVTILVTLIFFVFFLMSKERRGAEIVAHMPFLKVETRAFLAAQIDAFSDILVSFFQRQTVICLIEGVYYGAGFWLVGLPYGFLIGFSLGVMNLIPLFGSLVCLPLALPLAYFVGDGSLTRLVLVLVVWGAGQLLDGYCITPRIQGNKTGLGYAGVIFSFVLWSTLLGPMLGMLLAIPLSAFCVVLWRALKSKYIRPVV